MSAAAEVTAAGIARDVNAKRRRARDVAEAHLDRARALDKDLRAFLELDATSILEEAAEVDRRVDAGFRGPLAGVPVAVKDNLCVRGRTLTCASKILTGYRAPYDATAVRRLREAGAVVFGRTNMDEFAMGSSTEHSAFGVTRNPWNLACVPGGSSGGSAAAVAARLTPLALGSDTGGSIRQPAALCGILGLKPTYGRVSRYGLVAFASSLDQIGPFATNVEDLAIATAVLCGEDPLDSTSLTHAPPDGLAALRRGVRGLRLGIPAEWNGDGVDREVRAAVDRAIDRLCQEGAARVDVSLPSAGLSIPTYYLVATAEASSNLARFDGVRFGMRADAHGDLDALYGRTRDAGFGDEVKRRILLGTFVLSAGYADAYYKRALQTRALLRQEYERAFARCDVLVGPASPFPAFEIGSKIDDPLAMYWCDLFTAAINLVGLPGVSVPCGFTEKGLPIGLQVVAPALGEESLFAAAGCLERQGDWNRRIPKGFE